MRQKTVNKALPLLIGAAVIGLMPGQALAFRSWLKPSATQVDGQMAWVTIDAATSEGIFDFDNMPLKLDGLTITGPDGQPVAADAPTVGHLRSTFDAQLTKPGTYRFTALSATVMASYRQGSEIKRIRGTEDDLKTAPADATDLKVSRMISRVDTFVTYGKPNDTALQPTGKGLEMVPVTHPSDMLLGEPAKLRFLLDGKPLADLAVQVIPGGARFRNGLKDVNYTTNAAGEVTVNWPAAGDYLVSASYPPRLPGAGPQGGEGGGRQGGQGSAGQTPGGQAPAGQGPAGPGAGGPGGGRGFGGPATEVTPGNRYTYTATFEVLPN